MEFLMILSALLSALTGAFAGPRPADARVHQPAAAQSVAAAVPAVRVAAPASRAAKAIPEPLREAAPAVAPAAPLASLPIETDRLLE
jgi:hypothetical protein